ncbi:carboxypeptidase-like regulatory domain-containing protein [Mucilaginibacter pedocola]|uniref:Carboxypeptidase-like regulatory domain-containing protein n=1 Tax=Mucilaginibacter pedocola TaxID=1792845 RepID=A0A1S9PD03_9SPHI|nr:carboxypeptidase-like regulatory domain-containing protein [Mucilaginibacter pedocola]OOQ58830.1 hypothetical protein BC343_09295 [Mucilaginibacter pedocola]
MKQYLLFLLLLPLTAFSQVKITGKVLNATGGKPLGNVSVFLSNATVGSKTTDDGTFTLYNVRPGQYELVASAVGYSTYHIVVLAANADITVADIKLEAKTTELKEVAITGENDWEKNFAKFKTQFLGTSEAAAECKLTNYDALTLDYDKQTGKLSGSSNDFIELENKYLGYKIKYLLASFDWDERGGVLYFAGSSVFEDMNGSASQKKRWQKRRKEAYEGSSMQFLRGLVSDSIELKDFKAYRLIRKPNPQSKGLSDKYIQTLINKPLEKSEFLRPTNLSGIYAISFKDCLSIKYKSNRSTVVTIKSDYAFFDLNGIIANPADVFFEGAWGLNRMAEMLPVDYAVEK